MKTSLIVAAMCGIITSAPLHAQSVDTVPRGQRPPEGMCRVWIKGVPANQQPAPTDCASAVRNLPPNGRVIFGLQPVHSNQYAPPPATTTDTPSSQPPARNPKKKGGRPPF